MPDLNCLIIEDEPLAARVIEDYIFQIPGLKLTGICGDVFAASEKLRADKIDIIFLDINLPKVNGLEFIKSISPKYHIILTTAYHQYALDGFNLNVVDYLLKPIAFARFLQAVNKIPFPAAKTENKENKVSMQRQHHFFTADKKRYKIYFDEILYIESLKDYVKIHTSEKNIVTKFQIGEIEQVFKELKFFRIHKSYIVNLDYISAFNAHEVEIGKINLPVGRTYAELFKKHMGLE